MRFGIAIPQTYRDPVESIRELDLFLGEAEALGFDSLWVQEQMLGRDHSFEPLVMLAYAAARTTRVRLAAAAFVAPLRPPVGFAKSLATIDQLSRGRLVVGLALGDAIRFYSAFGIPPAERVARLEEGVEVMKRLWTEAETTLHGRFATLEAAAMEPKPVQRPHPPIWFGAKSPVALRRAVRLGDGWVGAGGSSIEDFEAGAIVIRDALAEARRARSSFTIAKKVYVAVADRREDAVRGLTRWFDVHWAGFATGEELMARVGIAGTPDDVVSAIRRIEAAGADLVVLNPVYDERDQLRRLAEAVVPAFATPGAAVEAA